MSDNTGASAPARAPVSEHDERYVPQSTRARVAGRGMGGRVAPERTLDRGVVVRAVRSALAITLAAASTACIAPFPSARNPKYDISTRSETPPPSRATDREPEGTEAAPDATAGPERITYRQLTRSDFQARSPRPSADLEPGHVIAGTCAALQPTQALRFRAVRQPGASEFVAEVVELGFEARMDPGCSWWGDTRSRPVEYVLQHEQIHFAIIELAARELNRRAGEIATAVRATGPTGPAAIAESRQRLLELLNDAVERTRERSRRFDQETSIGFSPERQQAWADEIEAELRATEGDTAAATSTPR